MKLLICKDCKEITLKIILIFGNGLVGKQIIRSLLRNHSFHVIDLTYSWNTNDEMYHNQKDNIVSKLNVLLLNNLPSIPEISLVWAAGKAGFYASKSNIEKELLDFKKVILLIGNIQSLRNNLEIRFFHTSSAGALFEGQKYIDAHSIIMPMRPYGWLKLDQEKIVNGLNIPGKYIYRLSSVYGDFSPLDRKNLVSALLYAGSRHEVCKVSGNLTTLRDFVNSQDVGSFIAQEIFSKKPLATAKPLVLASLKPCSIFEIRKTIEDHLKRKIYVSLDPDPDNALDITYAPSCVPPKSWYPVDIKTGIRRIQY